jgi:HD superfamily phosphohydrolase
MKTIILLCCAVTFFNCNGNKEDEKEMKFFPVLSFLKSQVAHVDTSLYNIIKIVTVDSTADTTYIKREEFRAHAKDFLDIPDITTKKLRKKYSESKLFDESIDKIVFNYTANDPDAEIRRQEVQVQPDQQNGDRVENIYIDHWISDKESSIQKKMMWYVNKRFSVVSIIQKKNQPEKIIKTEVVWNDFDNNR